MCSCSIFHLFSTYVLSILCTSFGLPLRNNTGNSVTSPVSSHDVISLYGEKYARTEEELDYFFKRQQRLNRSGIDIDVSTITLFHFPPFTTVGVCSLISLLISKVVAHIANNMNLDQRGAVWSGFIVFASMNVYKKHVTRRRYLHKTKWPMRPVLYYAFNRQLSTHVGLPIHLLHRIYPFRDTNRIKLSVFPFLRAKLRFWQCFLRRHSLKELRALRVEFGHLWIQKLKVVLLFTNFI